MSAPENEVRVPAGPKECRICLAQAECYGAYEGSEEPDFSCGEHCGHGNGDGWCVPVEGLP